MQEVIKNRTVKHLGSSRIDDVEFTAVDVNGKPVVIVTRENEFTNDFTVHGYVTFHPNTDEWDGVVSLPEDGVTSYVNKDGDQIMQDVAKLIIDYYDRPA